MRVAIEADLGVVRAFFEAQVFAMRLRLGVEQHLVGARVLVGAGVGDVFVLQDGESFQSLTAPWQRLEARR